MKLYPLCDPYIWEDLSVLRVTGFTVKKHPMHLGPCASELVNHILFIYVFALVLGGVTSLVIRSPYVVPATFAVATAYVLPSIWSLLTIRQKVEKREGFQSSSEAAMVPPPAPRDGLATSPTAANPFMNVTIDEIKYNPTRPAAEYISSPENKAVLDDFFRTEFNRDPTDVFGKTQSQRQFYANPATTIPNDQGAFADWLYKIPGKTCKEGGREACLPGTDGAAMPWLNADR